VRDGSLLYPFWSLFLLPLMLLGFAFLRFKGNGATHLLQLANLFSAALVVLCRHYGSHSRMVVNGSNPSLQPAFRAPHAPVRAA